MNRPDDDGILDAKLHKLAEITNRHLPGQPWFINVWIPNAPTKGWRVVHEVTAESASAPSDSMEPSE